MFSSIRGRLTYANVVSTLCLFLLLGGGAYAAANLKKDSVGSKQLKAGAVNTVDIAHDAVDGTRVKDGSLGGSDVDASSLGPVCPSALALKGDVCFEPNSHPATTQFAASNDCISRGLRLPTLGEGLLFTTGQPGSGELWTADRFQDGGVEYYNTVFFMNGGSDPSQAVGGGNSPASRQYRCVTTAH